MPCNHTLGQCGVHITVGVLDAFEALVPFAAKDK